MARATGTIAPGAQGAGSVSLLELFSSKRVSKTEVGGLLKKGGLAGTSFQRGRPCSFATKKLSHKEAQNAQRVKERFLCLLCLFVANVFCASLWLTSFVPLCGIRDNIEVHR